jgi:thiamine pyrophosphate-dependent acetolactate synthase large subunit-like protein
VTARHTGQAGLPVDLRSSDQQPDKQPKRSVGLLAPTSQRLHEPPRDVRRRNYPVEIGVVGDAKSCLSTLLDELLEIGPREDFRASTYFAELQDLKKRWEEHLDPMCTTDYLPMTISRAMVEIRKALPRNGILVTDSSNPANQARVLIDGDTYNSMARAFVRVLFQPPWAGEALPTGLAWAGQRRRCRW